MGKPLSKPIRRRSSLRNGCGQRIVLASVVSEKEAYIADFSISVRLDVTKKNLWALTKAGIHRYTPKGELSSKSVQPIQSYFISSPDGAVAIAPDKFIPAETAGFLLGGGEAGPAIELMMKMLGGESTQFGIRLKSEGLARVYSFKPQINESDAADFNGCIKGFMALVERTLEGLREDAASEP